MFDSILNGMTKKAAKKALYELLGDKFNGFFSDEYWKPVNTFFDDLNNAGIHWALIDATYEQDEKGTPIRKRWNIVFNFLNKKENLDIVYGTVVAAGAGSVNDPLGIYDLCFMVS